jgi:hypothetical protein
MRTNREIPQGLEKEDEKTIISSQRVQYFGPNLKRQVSQEHD